MAFPVILVNATGGSDTAASGAGPATALTGTAASFAGAVVTLDGSPSLTGVATDGSHVLYLLTSTGVRFFKITAKDDGADTVTVTPSPAGTSTGLTWAIGGKRASIGSASSYLLLTNAAAAGDAMPGWIIEMESGHTESFSAALQLTRAGDTTSGPIILRGTPGAATRPIITCTGSSFGIETNFVVMVRLENFELKNTGTGNYAIVLRYGEIVIRNVKIWGITDWSTVGILVPGTNPCHIECCEITNCAKGLMDSGTDNYTYIMGCSIHGCSSHGIHVSGGRGLILSNKIYGNGGDGINTGTESNGFRAWDIVNNTIHDNASDGIEITDAHDSTAASVITNNIFTNNGGYGINFSNATATAVWLNAMGMRLLNNTYGAGATANSSGTCNRAGVDSDSQTIDPDYVDAASGDFTPQEATLEGTAFPVLLP